MRKTGRNRFALINAFAATILPLMLLSSCAGANGDEVVTRAEFEDRRFLAIFATFERCSYDLDPTTRQQNSWVLFVESLRSGNNAFLSLQFPKDLAESYVTEKDANLCVISLLSIPCNDELIEGLALADTLHCNPARASLWQNQHLGQGEWSLPEGGPTF